MREVVSMPAEYAQSDQFRGARIHLCDLAGLEIRDCDVSGLKIVDCYGGDVYLGGGFERLVVNDVDVTAYVEAELDRLHPNRVLARDAASSVEYRAAWDAIETQWEETLDRARLLPEAKLHEQVNGEWSFVETQRHLLMAGDAWIGNAVLEEDAPYHPLGLPYGGMPPEAVGEARAHPRSHPDARRGTRAAARSHGHDAACRRRAHRGRARSGVWSQAGGPISRPGVRRAPLPHGGAQGRGRASPLRGTRPRRARGRCLNRVKAPTEEER